MFVPYAKKDDDKYSPFEVCHKMIDRYYEEIGKYPDLIKPAFTYQDIENKYGIVTEQEEIYKGMKQLMYYLLAISGVLTFLQCL